MNDELAEANLDWASLEEIRTESLMRCGGMCTCSPDGDGDPCPHGHFYEKAMTEAEWAKEQLKNWEYIPEEQEITEEDVIKEDIDGEAEGVNLDAPTLILTDEPTSETGNGEEENWYFDDATGTWKSS